VLTAPLDQLPKGCPQCRHHLRVFQRDCSDAAASEDFPDLRCGIRGDKHHDRGAELFDQGCDRGGRLECVDHADCPRLGHRSCHCGHGVRMVARNKAHGDVAERRELGMHLPGNVPDPALAIRPSSERKKPLIRAADEETSRGPIRSVMSCLAYPILDGARRGEPQVEAKQRAAVV